MTNLYGEPEEYINSAFIRGYIDQSGINRFVNRELASSNFDGYISTETASVAVSELSPGQSLAIETSGSISFFPIIAIDRQDPDLYGASYTGEHTIYYLNGQELINLIYSSSSTQVTVGRQIWSDKNVGTSGWYLSQEGNAIFANVAVRGRIEASEGYIGDSETGWEIGANLLSNASVGFYAPSAFTGSDIAIFSGSPFTGRSTAPFRVNYAGQMNATGASISGALTATTLDVGGSNGIVYNGSAVTIGASVNILAPVTVNSLQVGASPTLLKIADNVNGTNDGIYINDNNYWYSDGQFGVGGSANNVVWSGSTLAVTGDINATTITASNGTIAGFTLSNNQFSIPGITFSSSGGLRLGNPVTFSVDQNGNMVATSASISGDITANSGRFTGSISAQHITASVGEIAGFTLARSQLSTASVVVSSSGGFRLGSPVVFSVDQFGNLVANSASITGNINATSGAFSGSVSAQFITSSVGSIAGFTLSNNQLFTASIILSSSGGLRLGSPAVFSVDQFGNLVATSASISGNITATSGAFTGSVSAQHITASTGRVGGFSLNNDALYATNIVLSSSGGFNLGSPALYFPGIAGNYATVPHSSSLAITGDIDLRARVALDDWTPSSEQIIFRKWWDSATSYSLIMLSAGTIRITWTPDNTTFISMTSTSSVSVSNGSPKWIRATLDVDNGAGGRTATFYTSDNGTSWTQLGSTVTTAGTTSIYSGTSRVWIGDSAGTGIKVYRAQILNGIDGNTVLDVDTSVLVSSSQTSFSALTGQTVTITGASSMVLLSPFIVDTNGNLVATSASITGNITAQSGQFTGSISAQHITASTGTIAGFTLANNQLSTASVVVSSSGGLRLGSPVVFSVDQFGNLVATTASITGRINATSGSFSGDITASAGRFVGAVSVSSSGAIYAGNNFDSGQRTVLNASGLFGFHSNGLEAFALPVSGSPRLGTFTIIPTGIVSQSASNANMIYGNVDSSGSVTDGIVIRGFRTNGASAAIYNVQNGVATEFTGGGNGFYIDENARFKLKGATGSLSFDGTDLYIDGNINARSGNFTGSVRAQHITASVGIMGGFILSASSITDSATTASTVGITTGDTAFFAGANDQIGTNAQFRVTQTGSIFANAASITGDITATRITSSVGDVGGFLLSGTSLTSSADATSAVGVSTSASSFFAGATSRTGAGAQFWVSRTGSLFANAATIRGNITADSGQFTGSVSAQHITASTGNVGGWTLGASALTGNSASLNAQGSLILGVNQNIVALSSTDTNRIWAGSATSTTAPFRVSSVGFLTATGASITGNITAQSGTFTGSISAQHITASVGSIAGFTLANNQMSTASVIISSSGGFRLGNPTVFSVNQFGNLVANSASIIGNINAQSGSFTGTLGVFGSGNIYVGASANSGARIVINSADLTGYSPNSATTFKLVSGSGSTILDNPGFDGANLSPWVRFWGFSGTQSSASQDAVFYKEGGKSLRILATPGSPARTHTIDQYLGTKLTVGTEYIVSAWVYSASPLVGVSGSSGAEMWIISSSTTASPTYFGASTTGYTALTPPTAVPANVWTKLTAKFIPTVTNSTLSLRMWTSASTRVWWDSVDISESSNYSQISGFFFNDGAFYTDYLRIGSDGNVSLGLQSSASASSSEGADLSNILEMSGTDENYRFWVGNSNPDKALMNITKSGTININSGGDLILTSSAVGTSDSVLSKISFKTTGDSTSQGRVDYVPTSSWMNIGIATGANAFRQLRLTAGTTGSITLRGTVLGFDSNFVLDQNNTRIGIGTLSPTNTLTVVGTASVSSTLDIGGPTTITGLLQTNRNVTAATVRGIQVNSTNNYTTNWNAIEFTRNGTELGYIRVASAVGAPTLVSASDYRLKKNIQTDTRNFSNIINNLRPVTFEWKNIENAGTTYGFIAHEVQQYVPEAVGGTKDAVDENGEIIPQDLTQQPFVYYLVGAFKEALKEIDILKQRVLQLESTIERNNNV